MLPASPALEKRLAAYYASRFGVPASVFAELSLQSKKEEIWATTGRPLPGIRSARPAGLRVGRDFPQGFKPTSAFLCALGSHIVHGRVCIGSEHLEPLLLGRRIPWDSGDDGYVALDYAGDILGCGRIHRGRLHVLIPTGRRRELLEILRVRS